MKNIFDLASKELTQDAFLAWFISISDPNEERTDLEAYKASRAFIRELTTLDEKERIKRIIINRQKGKIDLSFRIITSKERIGLFIEDKVASQEHDNQLLKYNKVIKKLQTRWKLDKVYKVFFKTFYLDHLEKQRVEEAGWTIYSYLKVRDFFSKYNTAENIILRQFACHCKNVINELGNNDIPQTIKYDDKEKDIDEQNRYIAWKAYFDFRVWNVLKKFCYCWTEKTIHYTSLLRVRPKWHRNGDIPYLEICSKDLSNNKFIAKIRTCKIKKEDKEKEAQLIDNISRSKIFSKPNKGKWVIGTTAKNKLVYTNSNSFISNTCKCVKEYLKLINFWYK